MPAAGRADATAVQRRSDKLIQIARVFKVVPNGELVLVGKQVIEPSEELIIVFRLQDIEILRRNSQGSLGCVDQTDVVDQN